jgi:tetratricopeptide (TPR) repeat protein
MLAAIDWGCEHDPELAAAIIGSIWLYWHIRGRFHEGRDAGLKVIAAYHPKKANLLYARALNGLGVMFDRCCEFDRARETLTKAVDMAERAGASEAHADALNNLGGLLFNMGLYEEGRAYQERAMLLYREKGNERGVAMVSANLGNICCASKDFGAAEAYMQSALDANLRMGNRHWEANNLTSLGINALFRNDLERAAEMFGRSLEIKRELGHSVGIGVTLNYMVRLAMRQGEVEAAKKNLHEAAHVLAAMESPITFADTLTVASMYTATTGRWADSAMFDGAGAALRDRFAIKIHLFERQEVERRWQDVRTALGDEAYDAAFAIGYSLSPAQAVAAILTVS